MVGKWHGGFLPWFSPLKSGWDYFYGNYSGGVDYFSKYTTFGYDLYEGEQLTQDPRYYTEILTEKAVEVVRRAPAEEPVAVQPQLHLPHWPWEGPGDKAVSDEITAAHQGRDRTALFHYDGGSVDKYVEMVENLDAADRHRPARAAPDRPGGGHPGPLRQRQRRRAVLLQLAVQRQQGQRQRGRHPGPDDPVLARAGPRPAGRRRAGLHDRLDRDLPRARRRQPDPAYPLDGTSLVPHLFEGVACPQRDLFWRTRDGRALRRGDLKYVRLDGVDHLYDVEADSREQADLAKKRPQDLAALRTAWEQVNQGLLPYPARGPGATR